MGSAAPIGPSGKIPITYCLVPVGTPDYIAPDILELAEDQILSLSTHTPDADETAFVPDRAVWEYGPSVDWWSLGAVLFELATGLPPFWNQDISQTYQSIMDVGHGHCGAPSVDADSAIFGHLLQR